MSLPPRHAICLNSQIRPCGRPFSAECWNVTNKLKNAARIFSKHHSQHSWPTIHQRKRR